jgi:ABC-type multidrug transport system fused ATPase/permease subunit
MGNENATDEEIKSACALAKADELKESPIFSPMDMTE